MTVPALMLALMPVFTPSAITAPNLRSPVPSFLPPTTTEISRSSRRRFAIFVPAPRLTSLPRIESPT
jgi:hypothetical protein